MDQKIIFHIDMDAFFAAVEERENPQFRMMPIVVGADPKQGNGRGVVSTANYEARKYGVKSAMPISEAFRRCPNAVFLPVNGRLYQAVSENIMRMLRGYALTFEQVSIDEAFLDMSHLGTYRKAEMRARDIKKRIFLDERLTCSIGIGPNKLIAKIASDFKKPGGLTVVSPEKARAFIDPMPVQSIYGVGPRAAARLGSMGVKTVRDLRRIPLCRLQEIFGAHGRKMFEYARGIDQRKLKGKRAIKSIGRERTFLRDTRDMQLIFDTLDRLACEVIEEAARKRIACKTVTVAVRYEGFETHTKARTFSRPVASPKGLSRVAKQLALPYLLRTDKKMRLVGVRISNPLK